MRVYNGTKSQINLPLSGTQRITIPAHSVSGDIMPSNEFLSLLVSSYDYNELALIVSGPFEINMCAGISGSVGFVVQSLDEAIERFAPKECPKCNQDPCVCNKEKEKEPQPVDKKPAATPTKPAEKEKEKSVPETKEEKNK